MGALLRLAAMLVLNAAATAGMIGALLSRDWHTKAEPAQLPQRTRNPMKETRQAEPNSQIDPAPPTPATTTIPATTISHRSDDDDFSLVESDDIRIPGEGGGETAHRG